MSMILTLTFEYDDGPWLDDDGNENQADVLADNMDTVNTAVRALDGGYTTFVDARLDGKLLIDGDGAAPVEVKRLVQYESYIQIRRGGPSRGGER